MITRIKINGGRICFYYYYQPSLWESRVQMKTAVQLFEPLLDSVFYDAASFQALTHMDPLACLAYLRQRFTHDIIIKLPNQMLWLADACVQDRIDAAPFYQSCTSPAKDEHLFAQYCAARALGDSPGAVMANLLQFDLQAYPQLQSCNPYRNKPQQHYSM